MTIIRFFLQPYWAACLAMLGYGAWAAGVNASYGLRASLYAFAIQGIFAFLSTFASGSIALFIYNRIPSEPYKYGCALAVTMSLLCLVPYTVHRAAMTPNILAAMLPGFVIGTFYISQLLKPHCKNS